MSLKQEGEQIFRDESSEFRNEQERLTDSSRKHRDKAAVAGIVAGLATATGALTGGTIGGLVAGGVIGLELVHQLVASGVDLRKHELNKRKRHISARLHKTPIDERRKR